MSFVKYRVKEVAADFGVTPKDIAEIVGKYFEKPRSNTQVLTDEQLNVVFDAITQKHQIASLEQYCFGRQRGTHGNQRFHF